MNCGSVLVVDDDADVRDLVHRYLVTLEYTVSQAGSAEEALTLLESADPDLILTDLKMPGMDGLGLAERALTADPDRPVILMTAFADLENARRSIALGVYDFIVKPFDLKDFGNAVRRALDHRRLVLQNRAYQANLERMVTERTQALEEALERLDRKVRELEGRDRISQLMMTVHAREETLAGILEAVTAAVPAERVALLLPSAGRGTLEMAAGTGNREPGDVLTDPGKTEGAPVPWVEEARALALRAYQEVQCQEPENGGSGGVAVPLLRLGEAVGVIFAQNPFSQKRLAPEDLQLLQALAAPAAVALSDALLYGDGERWGAMMSRLEHGTP
jgi:CheY-like chemotaxis protein